MAVGVGVGVGVGVAVGVGVGVGVGVAVASECSVSVIGASIVIEAGLVVPEKEPVPLPVQLLKINRQSVCLIETAESASLSIH